MRTVLNKKLKIYLRLPIHVRSVQGARPTWNSFPSQICTGYLTNQYNCTIIAITSRRRGYCLGGKSDTGGKFEILDGVGG